MVISMLKIRRPLGRLIFNMGIAIPGKTVFLIETAPRNALQLRPTDRMRAQPWNMRTQSDMQSRDIGIYCRDIPIPIPLSALTSVAALRLDNVSCQSWAANLRCSTRSVLEGTNKPLGLIKSDESCPAFIMGIRLLVRLYPR